MLTPEAESDVEVFETAALSAVVFDRAPFGISLTDARPQSFGRYLAANPAYCAITGYSSEELRGRSFHDLVHARDLPALLNELESLCSGALGAVDVEMRLHRPDHSAVWVRQHRSVVRTADGQPLFFLTHTEDISKRKSEEAAAVAARRRAQAALHASESRYRLLADTVADMIVRTRSDRSRSYVSPASKTLLGYEPAEIIETDFANFLHPEDRRRVEAEYERFLREGERETHTYRLRHRDGTYVWCEAAWVRAPWDPETDDDSDAGSAVISVVRNISERKAAEAQIAFLARHDALTGLPNRLLFGERLRDALDLLHAGSSAAVLIVDLDHFKFVNDTLGHAAGDALLRCAAERLRACVRGSDTVARFGGDEFVILMTDLRDANEASHVAQRIVDAMNAPWTIEGHRVVVAASVGVAQAPHHGTTADVLLKNADLALYQAKREGRATFRFFAAEMEARIRARHELELDLRQALHDDAFTLAYQPIVDLGSNAVVGFEALLRWAHPTRGMVPPSEFIPVAEECGAIVALGERVLRDACAQAKAWPESMKLAVNLSPIQLSDPSLVATVRAVLAESGLAADRLELEITESVLLKENERTLGALHELRSLGVGICLDDFGTGYSSLGYLRSFPFDKIKIDRSFVGDLLVCPESAAIVRAVTDLARTLGVATVAEGVETAAQLERVRAEGCTQAQGYLFSRPRPAHELAAFL